VLTGIRGIFFDVGGTLVRPTEEMADVISEEAAGIGVTLSPAIPAPLPSLVSLRLTERAREGRPFSFPAGASEAFWKGIYVGVLAGACPPEVAWQIAEQTYGRLASPAAYSLYPDVLETLRELRASGYTLGIISNWEAWLPRLLASTRLDALLEHVVISADVEVEKPDRRIFEIAVERSGLPPSELLYVGDNPDVDVRAAVDAGLRALLLVRDAGETIAPPGAIVSLAELATIMPARTPGPSRP
jgi:putative hydrolase of the HAD superfamily